MKKLVLLFCLFLVFVACGKDEKTIEKIIYGDKVSTVLDKKDYDKISVTSSFNSFDEFAVYAKQCADNKTNLVGKKFKIKDNFNIYKDGFHSIDEKHYYFIYANLFNEEGVEIVIRFINTNPDVNPPSQMEKEFTCIVTEFTEVSHISVKGYSYDI